LKLFNLQLKQASPYLSYGVLVLFAIFCLFYAFYNGNNCASASVNPSDFCKRIGITIQNNGASETYSPVRIPFNPEGMTSLNYVDNFGSQALSSDDTYNPINYMSQSLSSTASAGWWFVMPSLPIVTLKNMEFYVGNVNQSAWRDNGFYFYNNSTSTDDVITIPNNANFNLTDNFNLEADVVLTGTSGFTCPLGTPSADSGFIIDRWDSNTGYALGVECEQGVMYNFIQIEDTKVRASTSTFNTRYNLKGKYEAPDITLLVDDVSAATGTKASMSSYNSNITMGNGLRKVEILNAQISKNITTTNDIELRYNFDPTDVKELEALTPYYTGSILDVSNNNHHATYSLNRPQNYSITIASATGIGLQQLVDNPQADIQVVNTLSSGLAVVGNENSNFPFYPMLNSIATTSGLPRQMTFGGLFAVLAMIVSSIILLATRTIPLAIFSYGVVMYLGYLNNFYAIWYVLIIIFILVATYGSSKYLSEGF